MIARLFSQKPDDSFTLSHRSLMRLMFKLLFWSYFPILLCIGLVQPLSAQINFRYPGPDVPVFGAIPMQAFAMDPADTTENDYRYLYKGMDVRFEVKGDRIHALITHHLRIRVQTQFGTMAGLISIPLYAENDLETLESIEASTWLSPGRSLPLDPETRRQVKVNERYTITEFSMPEVKPGVVLDIRYTVRRRYLEELPDFNVMMNQPVDFAMVRLVNSTFLRYRAIPINGNGELNVNEARVDTGLVRNIFEGRSSEPLLVQSWHARNVPALREEPLSGSADDYRWRIKFQWSEFGNPRQYLESGWDVVAAELRRRPGLYSQIERYEAGRRIGAGFGLRVADTRARVDSIYAFVRDQANASVNRGVTSEEDPAIVLEGQPASPALINQVLISILRGAGVPAWPLLTASREYGKILTDFPSYYQFNRLLVFVQLPGEALLLDATDPFSKVGMIPDDLVGSDGFILKEEDYAWVKLRTDQTQSHLEVQFDGRLDRNGSLTGRLRSQHQGLKSRQFEQRAFSMPDPIALAEELLFRNANRASYRKASIIPATKGSDPGLDLDIQMNRFATSFREGLEFNPMLVGWLEVNPLGEGPRRLPVSVDIPESFSLIVNLALPAGYRMPRPSDTQEASMTGASIKVAYRQEGDTLRYRVDVGLDAVTVPPENIAEIRQFYDSWVALSSARWFLERRGNP